MKYIHAFGIHPDHRFYRIMQDGRIIAEGGQEILDNAIPDAEFFWDCEYGWRQCYSYEYINPNSTAVNIDGIAYERFINSGDFKRSYVGDEFYDGELYKVEETPEGTVWT